MKNVFLLAKSAMLPFLFFAMGLVLFVTTLYHEKFLSPPPEQFGFPASFAYGLLAVHNEWAIMTGWVGMIGGALALILSVQNERLRLTQEAT